MPLTVERFRNDDVLIRLNASNTINTSKMQADTQRHVMHAEKSRKSLRNRPAINYSQFDYSSDEELSTEVFEHRVHPILRKKGVIRGCPNCMNCQKVLARWHPLDACRPVIDEAPVFYPSEEEFEDTLKYIESIRAKAESYGVCRIVPPPSWKPTCPLKEKVVWENSRFATRVQRVDLLQKRHSIKQKSRLNAFMWKKRRLLTTELEHENKNKDFVKSDGDCPSNSAENFGFEPGPDFTLESFQKYADDFKTQYFLVKNKALGKNMELDHPQIHWEPTEEDIEGEYWRIVEKPTEEIEVLYWADLDSGYFGSGFPKAASIPSDNNIENEYAKSGWNLNKFPRLTGSVLAFEGEDISGVLVPWLYIGMCFSSFCWHVEDHHLYSLNYMHWGAPKMWYAVPGKDALLLEEAMKKHLPDLFEEQPDLLHKLVTQFSPSMLRSEGVPVYRCVQHSGEFVITFPRAYHSGFNCGFNCAEAVNVAPVDWLPHGQSAVELYHDQGRKISISHDKLLLGAAREAVRAQWDILFLKKITSDNLIWKNACGQDKILTKALKARVEMERARREHLCFSQSRKMDASFDSTGDQECFICHYDLHLSAASCACFPDKFACLDHAKQMCTCDSGTRSLLFRYDLSELNVLIDALGGKLSAVHRWGLLDLGRSLRAYTQQKSQRQVIARETLSEAREKKKLSEGTSSNLLSFNEQNYNQKGNHQVTVNGSEASHEKDTGCEEVQLMKRQITSGLGTKHTIQKIMVKESNCDGDSVSLGAMPYSERDGKILSAGNLIGMDLNGVQKELLQTNKMKDLIGKGMGLSVRVEDYNYKVTACTQREVLQTCQSNAAAMDDHDAALLESKEAVGNLGFFSNVREDGKREALSESVYISQDQPSSASFLRNSSNIIITRTVSNLIPQVPASNEVSGDEKLNIGNNSYNLPIHGNSKAIDAFNGQEVEIDSPSVESGKRGLIRGSESCLIISTDRDNLWNGPRVAKVVHRMSCNAEVLNFGMVLSGRLWSTSQVIFPKGYKSRVKYINVLDPAQMCYYVSEILDGGEHGPLFMVRVEHYPSEVFIHVSATKCWNIVRERVNNEIRRLYSFGKFGIPTLQVPGFIDGLEMFGLTSPTIIQAIEALDHDHLSLEYWTSKSLNQKPPISDGGTRSIVKEEPKVHETPSNPGSGSILHRLLDKANYEELQVLHQLLTSNRSSSNQETIQILNKAIQRSSPLTVSECTNLI